MSRGVSSLQLIWLRSDLRVHDNTALSAAAARGPCVAVYLLSPAQWLAHDDAPCKVDFWLRNLRDLSQTLARLNIPLLIREASHWDVAADSGNVKTHAFCPICGSPVYLTFAAMPDLFTVHAASLDNPGRYKPQMVFYGVRGHAWDHVDRALPKFDRMPPA